jgi:MFS family permease
LSAPNTVLKIRDFRLALLARLFDSLAIQMLAVAAGWQVYQLIRDPLPLGFIGLAEALPFMGVSLWAGHLADRREKRRIIVNAEAGIMCSALGLLSLALLRTPSLLPIYFFLGWGGLCRSFQWSAMAAYVQLVVPREIYPRAAAWSSSAWHSAAIAGPVLGGAFYGFFGPAVTYAIVALLFLIALILTTRMTKVPPSRMKETEPGWADFLSGLRFVFSQEVILGAMSLDMFAVLFGGVVGILPIFADLLGVGPAGLGFLRSAPAAGALVCSLALAHRHPFKRTGVVMLNAVTVFGLCMIVFALSKNFVLSLAVLALGGAADAVSMVIRPSIYQALTPDHLKGRVSSVNGLFIRSSNEIGTFESGLAAKILGTVPSVIFGGGMTLFSVAVALWKAPGLRRFRLRESVLRKEML